jgi:tetratricopeptide (TPR) repeat protein
MKNKSILLCILFLFLIQHSDGKDDKKRKSGSDCPIQSKEIAIEELFPMEVTTDESDFIAELIPEVEAIQAKIKQKTTLLDNLQVRVQWNESAIHFLVHRLHAVRYEFLEEVIESLIEKKSQEVFDLGVYLFQKQLPGEASQIFKCLLNQPVPLEMILQAQYWVGECYKELGAYHEALMAYSTVVGTGASVVTDDALMASGLCYIKMGDTHKAKDCFEKLLERFPSSDLAETVLWHLNRL